MVWMRCFGITIGGGVGVWAFGSLRCMWYLGVVCSLVCVRRGNVFGCFTYGYRVEGYIWAFASADVCYLWLVVWARCCGALSVLRGLVCFVDGGEVFLYNIL